MSRSAVIGPAVATKLPQTVCFKKYILNLNCNRYLFVNIGKVNQVKFFKQEKYKSN